MFNSITTHFLYGIVNLAFGSSEKIYSAERPAPQGILPGPSKGKITVIANIASGCGFVRQLSELQELLTHYKNEVVVCAYPSDDFKQERRSEDELLQFCQSNFSTTFPIYPQCHVRGSKASPLFSWLCNEANSRLAMPIMWNFEKFLLDNNGCLRARFRPFTTPRSNRFRNAIEHLLNEKRLHHETFPMRSIEQL